MEPEALKDVLAQSGGLWSHWGFEPWRRGPLAGVARRQRFVKDGFLGPIAEYGAWDHIIWEPGTADDRRQLWQSSRPQPEIMTSRFLFILPETWPERRIRSFWLGFKGYLEFHSYWPGSARPGEGQAPADLTGLVDLALSPQSRSKT